jgi:hypothetical protein
MLIQVLHYRLEKHSFFGRLLMLYKIEPVGVVGGKDHIVAIKVFDHPVVHQGHYPACVLMHALVDDEYGLTFSQRGVDQYGRIQLEYHSHGYLAFHWSYLPCSLI